MAYPRCGVCRVWDVRVSRNEQRISELQSGVRYRYEGYSVGLLSGSQPEGLAMGDLWGHDEADYDWMFLFGGTLGVFVPEGQQPRGESCLDFRPEGCPPAFTKLLITDLPALMGDWDVKHWIEESVHISGDQCWLNTHQAVRGMRLYNKTFSGPAAQRGRRDLVSTLVCSAPHPAMYQEFANRTGQWPPAALISDLLKLPMLLVLVGHKLSPESHLEARISWSHLELKLIQELPLSVRQGYIACKYVMKRFLKARRYPNEAYEGRSSVSSYHIKTTLLRYSEKTPQSIITSPFRLFLDLLKELNEYVKMRNLPHYFVAQCNLLETVTEDELCLARQAIQEILSDSLNALLTSPTRPQQIYGEVHPDYLVSAFSKVSSHPMCEQSWNDLSELLAHVDERRRQIYRQQRERDEMRDHKVSGRAELTGLVDTLKRIKHH